MDGKYADIILPFAVRGRFTYAIPDDLAVKPGMRVRVQFGGRNLYSGIVSAVHNNIPDLKEVKAILSVFDDVPVINEYQLRLWSWISEYYLCAEGEVMKAAMPSEKSLAEYRPRLESYVDLAAEFTEKQLNDILDSLKKAPKQAKILMSYISLSGYPDNKNQLPVMKDALLDDSGSSNTILNGLFKKGILKPVLVPVSRITSGTRIGEPLKELSEAQEKAFLSVSAQLKDKEVALLKGVTSSGKTEIYIHLIEQQLKEGKQVLYMLPEIALTSQIIQRLKKHFGKVTGIYHSRFSDAEKVEIWKKVAEDDQLNGYRLVLGVRSSVFLPFSNLGLIIVDEEHDSSYKQQDPAPRYHARDTAIMLAGLHKAKTVLGSASPSVESYHNAVSGKYGLTELNERYGLIKLPEIVIANTREAYRKKLMVSHFTPELLFAMDVALERNEQIILFQNRRGFAPYLECSECGWIPSCIHCAVNLTYHKGIKKLVCHYCGYTTGLPSKCDNCSSSGMVTRGFGTEKIEDEIKLVFPSARVGRMDQDTTRNKNSFDKIIKAFEEREIDILIGTQMISKGLDFENLTVVGVLNADNLLNYPDFRAHERSFQLIEQVSGRAGRRQKQGRVIIQTADPTHRIIRFVIRHDYAGMFRIQEEERMTFNYPPFCRMIRLSVKHKDRAKLNYFSELLGNDLRAIFGKRILGPEYPVISQIQSWYIKNILIKIERGQATARAKKIILASIEKCGKEPGASALRIIVDVDPY